MTAEFKRTRSLWSTCLACSGFGLEFSVERVDCLDVGACL